MTQKLFFVVQKEFLVHLCVEGLLKHEKHKDVGSLMERFLRSGCRLSREPFFVIPVSFLNNVIESAKQKKLHCL